VAYQLSLIAGRLRWSLNILLSLLIILSQIGHRHKKDGKCLWDRSIRSNTPSIEAIDTPPIHDKMMYIVDLFTKVQMELPKNIAESLPNHKTVR